jgi:hypothetical protein
MYRNSLIFLIVVVALVHCFGRIYGKELEAKVAQAELPAGLSESTAVYDGIDSVYIFGG